MTENKLPTTGKITKKKYKCRRCGAIEEHETNHWGAIYPRCKSCSWKNPMNPQVTMDCMEPMPEGYEKPEEWQSVKLGDLLETPEETKEREKKEMNENVIKFKEEYGESKEGNFFICDTIGVPHPYCIGSKHVEIASDHHCGMLNDSAIKHAESLGIHCEVRGCNLSYEQHEQALLICCKKEMSEGNQMNPELHEWIMTYKDRIEQEKKYAGFAFIQYDAWKEN